MLALQATQNRRRPEQQVKVMFTEPPMTEREHRLVTAQERTSERNEGASRSDLPQENGGNRTISGG